MMDEFNVMDRVIYKKTLEQGVVSSKNDEVIFVKYYRNGKLANTAQATYPRDLIKVNLSDKDSSRRFLQLKIIEKDIECSEPCWECQNYIWSTKGCVRLEIEKIEQEMKIEKRNKRIAEEE